MGFLSRNRTALPKRSQRRKCVRNLKLSVKAFRNEIDVCAKSAYGRRSRNASTRQNLDLDFRFRQSGRLDVVGAWAVELRQLRNLFRALRSVHFSSPEGFGICDNAKFF